MNHNFIMIKKGVGIEIIATKYQFNNYQYTIMSIKDPKNFAIFITLRVQRSTIISLLVS